MYDIRLGGNSSTQTFRDFRFQGGNVSGGSGIFTGAVIVRWRQDMILLNVPKKLHEIGKNVGR